MFLLVHLATGLPAQDNPPGLTAPPAAKTATNVPSATPPNLAGQAATNDPISASNRIEQIRRALQRSVTNRVARGATSNVPVPQLPATPEAAAVPPAAA